MNILCKENINIHDSVLCGWNVVIRDHDGHNIYDKNHNLINPNKPVEIQSDVWIGSFANILKGVNIGKEVVIGGHSIVTKNIENSVIAVGVPAKVVKRDITWER